MKKFTVEVSVVPGTTKNVNLEGKDNTVATAVAAAGYAVENYLLRINGEEVKADTKIDSETAEILCLKTQIKGN